MIRPPPALPLFDEWYAADLEKRAKLMEGYDAEDVKWRRETQTFALIWLALAVVTMLVGGIAAVWWLHWYTSMLVMR